MTSKAYLKSVANPWGHCLAVIKLGKRECILESSSFPALGGVLVFQFYGKVSSFISKQVLFPKEAIYCRIYYTMQQRAVDGHFRVLFYFMCPLLLNSLTLGYGNTGCGVFRRGIQNQKYFCLRINLPQRKLLNFEFWINGELSNSAKI